MSVPVMPKMSFPLTGNMPLCRASAGRHKQNNAPEIKASAKVGDRWSEDTMDNTYLKYMSLPNSRIWMRLRARSIRGVKVNKILS